MRYYRPTWAEVNLDNIAYNFAQLRKVVAPGVKIMATIKADAYGHGLIPVAKRLAQEGADWLGVASIDEGIKLRQAGIKLPVLVLGLGLPSDIAALFRYRLTPTLAEMGFARALNAKAKALRRPIEAHIKVDTGMGRIGVLHQDAESLVRQICRFPFIRVQGLFTHFAFADLNREFTQYQIGLFRELVAKIRGCGISMPFTHAANSAGMINFRDSHFNLVRPGLVLYGLSPGKGFKIKLRPALSLKTRVIFSKLLPAGYGISYGHGYVTKKNTRVVTLPIGYGDGYPRNLSNIGPVLIRGRRFQISGRVCMDQVMVDVGNLPVRAGEEAVLIGRQGNKSITAEEIAALCGTIPYEIVCGLGSRIPRVYL